MSDSPIFVGGMFRSGTTLLRAMLGRHSRLFAGLETQWFLETWADIQDRRRWLERLSVFFDVPADELEAECEDATRPEDCLDHVMNFLTRRAGKQRWVEKTPGNVAVIPRILEHWPNARIVHIIRDPRDVYASLIESGKWATPGEFVERWCSTAAKAREWLSGEGGDHPAYFELRYERLVQDPEGQIAEVLSFLGERLEPAVAGFSGQPGDFALVRRATGKESSTLRRLAEPLSTGRIGVWRNVVPAAQWEEIRRLVDACGGRHLLEEFILQARGVGP